MWRFIELAQSNSDYYDDGDIMFASLREEISQLLRGAKLDFLIDFTVFWLTKKDALDNDEVNQGVIAATGGIGCDGFDYFSDCVVARGREVYNDVLTSPQALSPEHKVFSYGEFGFAFCAGDLVSNPDSGYSVCEDEFWNIVHKRTGRIA